MKKYNVTIYTTSEDLVVRTICDEHTINELGDYEDVKVLRIDDHTHDKGFILQGSQIVGIEWEEIKDEL
jgi:hypothetical protein